MRKITHGMTNTKVYMTWARMKSRVTNKKDNSYKNYGGRGILISKSWYKFNSFYKDIGDPPTLKHTLDRIDVNGNYCKENCKWSTIKEQLRNKRNNRIIKYNSEKKCVIDWCKELSIGYQTMIKRLNNNWSIERAFTTPVNENYSRKRRK